MKIYLAVLLLGSAAVLQASLLPLLFGEAVPDLVFVLLLAWAIHADTRTGVAWAFVGGLLLDLLSAAPLGTSIVGLLLVVFLVSGLGTQIYSISLPLVLLLAAVGTLLRLGALYGLVVVMARAGLLGFPEQPSALVFLPDPASTILPTLLYNLILIWPAYWLIRRGQRRWLRSE